MYMYIYSQENINDSILFKFYWKATPLQIFSSKICQAF